MTKRKNYFRSAIDAMMAARTREAERFIAYYRPAIEKTDSEASRR
jgi:hypothetical protein